MILEANPRLNSQTKVAHLSPRIAHQARITNIDQRVKLRKPKMKISELSAIVAPRTCAQTGQLLCAQVYFYSSENIGQNEDGSPIFILFMPDCLGRLLILGANYLVYNISF
jgi:hypothetical protein